jgi:hypothetical protein
MKRISLSIAMLLALGVALETSARASPTAVDVVKIAVIDPRTNRELAVLDPGGTMTLPPDEERLLRLFEPPEQGRSERQAIPAEFGFGPTQTALQITSHSVTRGEAVVRLRRGANASGGGGAALHVGYHIDDDVDLANENMRLGRVLVDVSSGGGSADDVIAALYRGILLRAPDPAAAARRDDIARNGYTGVLRQAREIAESRESEIDVYQRGACNQQRLLALYKELLGREAAQIDQRTWRAQLQHLERGDIAEVVTEIVESRDFQTRFDLRVRGRRR